MNINETVRWLMERDNFIILTHRRPDGDTLGSAAGLAQGLSEAGKTAYILPNPEATKRFIPYVKMYYAPTGFVPEHVIAVDIASPGLFAANAGEYAVELCIDHHPSNTNYAANTCLDVTRAACGEIIYDILRAMNGGVSSTEASVLYIAISTDTGCFAFGNTTSNSLRVAADLADAGAPIAILNRYLFRTKAKSRVMLEAMITSNMEFYFGGAVAIATISMEMMQKCGASENEMDDVASIPGSIEGVIVGITVREMSGPEDCKVSVRSTQKVNSNDLCARFGGGGHAMAAGFSIHSTTSEIKRLLVEALGELFPLEIK